MTPTIIYQDNAIIILNKPSGVTVNKADTTKDEITVQDWVEKEFKIKNLIHQSSTSLNLRKDLGVEDLTSDPNKTDPIQKTQENSGEYLTPKEDFYNRAGIVHRLDKETSGILVVAKTPEAFVNLQRQFKERIVKKTYIALAHGTMLPKEGEIRVPVGRLAWNRKRFGVVSGGREAVTKYYVENIMYYITGSKNKKEPLSLLQLYPTTGRTHQIRVHLKYMNHPIFSDLLYAGRKTARNDRKMLSRLFLHASVISFIHPTTGERVEFTSKLPQELDQFLLVLKN